MLVLSQEPWSAAAIDKAGTIVAAAAAEAQRRASGPLDWLLLLLPLGEDEAEAAPFATAMGAVAKANNAYVAGAARLVPAAGGAPVTTGFLYGPDGAELLSVGKITPDLIEGFSDTATLPPSEATFPVAKLPFVQVGILPGEDALFAQYGRALTFNGAELMLNPCIERTDLVIKSRGFSRFGRAVDAAGFMAVASPKSTMVNGLRTDLPTATAFYNWEYELLRAKGNESFVFPDFDIEAVRRKRMMPEVTYSAMVRANAFGEGYKRWAGEIGDLPMPSSREAWLKEAERRLALEAERFGPKLDHYELQYGAVTVQPTGRFIPMNSPDTREIALATIQDTFDFLGPKIGAPSTRLLVFPEFWIAGSGGRGGGQRVVSDLEPLAISIGDEVFEKIQKFAQEKGVYVAFESFELHPKLPHRVFNSAFLIDDGGNLINVYRKNQCADVWGGLPDTVPGSIFEQYVDTFGFEGLWPVVDTPLGKIGTMVCFDHAFPEVAHALRHFGAEVICHPTGEGHGRAGSGRAPWDNHRYLRGWENGAYILSANGGGRVSENKAETSVFQSRGYSFIINYDGTIHGVIDGPGQAMLPGQIDLAALRRFRADPRYNLHIWNNPAAYEKIYNGPIGMPNDLWAGDPFDNPYVRNKALNEVIAGYVERGIYVAPGSSDAMKAVSTSAE